MPAPTEYRVTLTYAQSATDFGKLTEEDAEHRLGRWERAHPQFGPVMSYDVKHAACDIVIALEALGAEHAIYTTLAYEADTWEDGELSIPVQGFSAIPTALDD